MKNIRFIVILVVMVGYTAVTEAQVDSIRVVEPGTSLELNPRQDTLWVISNQQMEQALTLAEKGRLFDSLALKYEALKAYQDSIMGRKNRVIKRLDSGYNRYTQKWDTCNRKLEQAKINLEKARQNQTKIGLISGGGGVVLTTLLFLLL